MGIDSKNQEIIGTSIKTNAVLNAIKTCSSILFPLITFPYISRVLLPENVGKIYFSASIVSYFSLLATLGIQTYAIRECSIVRNDKNELGNTASQIYSINIITTIVSYCLLAFTLYNYTRLDNYRIIIVIQSLVIIVTTLGADWLNSAMEDFRYITIRSVLFQFLGFILMLIFVRQPEDYIKFVFISLLSAVGTSILDIWYRQKYCRVKFIVNIWNGIAWKKHLVPILYLFAMMFAQTIFNSVDNTMLGLMYGDREVGIYSTAHKMQNAITQVIVSIAFVVMPRMSFYFSMNDYSNINRLYRKVFCYFCTLGLPCILGTSMLSQEIVEIVAGVEYSEAASVLVILMIGYIPNLFGGSLFGNIILLPSRREKLLMIACCVAAIFNIITNYFLIPYWGASGAAIATGLCNVCIGCILIIFKDDKIQLYNVRKTILTTIVGCLGIMTVCICCYQISFIGIRTIVAILCSFFVYVVVLYLGKNELFMEATEIVLKRIKE